MNVLPSDLARILVPTDVIQRRVKELADQISAEYQQAGQIHLVGILKGAFIFLADLTRQLSIPHTVDFMALMDLREPIENRHVIIVEDILDTGNTLEYLCHSLQGRSPASLKTCILTRKLRDGLTTQVDYLGFEIPDVWVVGYGLDYAERYRTLPYIAELKR
jgi:hypoxanthine phosphoribosyltransferase